MDFKIVILSLALLAFEVSGLMFDLQPNGRKCLKEEVQKDALVTGDYEISEVPGQRTDLKVSSCIILTPSNCTNNVSVLPGHRQQRPHTCKQ